MHYLYKILNWKRCLALSVAVLISLIVFSFYGLYSNKFYLFKLDNYIFPLISLTHFAFLYVFWFKIKEQEYPDLMMRNLEYILYAIFLVYIFNTFNTVSILMSYEDFSDHIIPDTFFPVGSVMVGLQVLLLMLTLITFGHRKRLIGDYRTDYLEEHVEPWE